MDLLELTGVCHRLIADYSMGMRKKTALAAALLHRPRFIPAVTDLSSPRTLGAFGR
jgi:ABC-type Na+ transport system ATPase subunit NatA